MVVPCSMPSHRTGGLRASWLVLPRPKATGWPTPSCGGDVIPPPQWPRPRTSASPWDPTIRTSESGPPARFVGAWRRVWRPVPSTCWLADTLLRWRGDGGFRGRYWRAHWASAYGAQVATTADPGVTPELHAWYASARQVVETVHSCLVGTFGLTFPGARSAWGLLARLAAKVAAFNVALLINVRFGRPPFSIFNPLD